MTGDPAFTCGNNTLNQVCFSWAVGRPAADLHGSQLFHHICVTVMDLTDMSNSFCVTACVCLWTEAYIRVLCFVLSPGTSRAQVIQAVARGLVY